jgi:hypothetical protein
MEAESTELLLHTEVRGLSKGKASKRMYDLHEESAVSDNGNVKLKDLFCRHEKSNPSTYLADPVCLPSVTILNFLCKSIIFSITDSHDKIIIFSDESGFMVIKIRRKKAYMLPNLDARLQESDNGTNLNVGTFSEIKALLFSF